MIIALIATGVGAPAGVGLLGMGLSVGGAATLFAQDSYEYATARTEEELMARARENQDNLVWAAGGLAEGVLGGLTVGRVALATKYSGLYYGDKVAIESAGFRYGYTSLYKNPNEPARFRIFLEKVSNDFPRKMQRLTFWHEKYGEIPKNWYDENGKVLHKGPIDIPWRDSPELQTLLNKYKLGWNEFNEELAADVAASFIKGRSNMIAIRKFVGGPDWWEQYPELVKFVESKIPWWWKTHNNGLVSIGGIDGTIVAGEILRK